MTTPITESIALRLALAAKALPQYSLEQVVDKFTTLLGSNITEKKLRNISPKQLRELFENPIDSPDRVQLAQAFAILTGDEISTMEAPQVPELPAIKGPKLRVAVTSNNKEQLDGHFGSCLRVLVYEVNAEKYQLVDVRPVTATKGGDIRTENMLELLHDCHIMATMSIGGPAAARVINSDIHPLKNANGGHSGDLLERIAISLAAKPAPWLQKILDKQLVEQAA